MEDVERTNEGIEEERDLGKITEYVRKKVDDFESGIIDEVQLTQATLPYVIELSVRLEENNRTNFARIDKINRTWEKMQLRILELEFLEKLTYSYLDQKGLTEDFLDFTQNEIDRSKVMIQ